MQRGTWGRAVPARLGLGCLPLGGGYGRVDPARALRLVRHALDSGAALLDAAEPDAGGEVLRLVGRAVAGRRDEAVITAHSRPLTAPAADAAATPAAACDRALALLGVDHLDLFYLHPPGSPEPVEETVGAAAALVAAGKVGALGIAGVDAGQLVRAHAVHPLATVAVEYSLLDRGAERDLLPAARRLGLLVTAVRPLAGGLLAGRIAARADLGPGDARLADPRFSVERLAAVRELLTELQSTASRHDLGAARLALAWLLSRGEDVLPLPGTRDRVHLEMNLSARRIELPAPARETLTALFAPPS
ncbi:aldo/keto reductase [Kitasatospora camelliae]|uniref:Aldo/keto reductase n=1 Tax=Kitasatospora camelliae TaxID=3156397 RepID=A0AAU8JSS0_9ACTN